MSYTAKLGTINSGLGNLVLGIDDVNAIDPGLIQSSFVPTNVITLNQVRNLEVTSTLTFTQSFAKPLSVTDTLTLTQDSSGIVRIIPRTIQSNITFTQSYYVNQIPIMDHLTINQTIGVSRVSNLEITSTLTTTQKVNQVFTLNLTNTLNVTQTDPSSIKQKTGNSTSTLTLTQSNTYLRLINKRIDSNIFLVQSIAKNIVANKIASNNLTISQSVVAINAKPVSNTLALSQLLTVDKAKRIQNILTMTQSLSRQLTSVRTYLQLFTPFQRLSRNVLYNRLQTNTLAITQSINVFLAKFVVDTLTLNQIITVLNVKNVTSDLSLLQQIDLNQVRNITISDELIFEQTAICNKVYSRTVSNALGFEQNIKKAKAYQRTVTNTFVIGQEVYRTRYNRTVTSDFTPSNVITKSWVASRTVNNNITLASTLTRASTYSRLVTSNLEFIKQYHALIGTYEFTMPTLYVAKSQRYTVMKGATRTIVLPNPEFGDAEANTGKFSLRRGMAGKVYTYVKKTDFRKLSYTFQIGKTKSRELMDFIKENNTNVITITNFKGETWFVYLTSNPNDLVTQSRFASSCNPDRDREKVSVTLEFEGVKVGSPLVNSPIVRR